MKQNEPLDKFAELRAQHRILMDWFNSQGVDAHDALRLAGVVAADVIVWHAPDPEAQLKWFVNAVTAASQRGWSPAELAAIKRLNDDAAGALDHSELRSGARGGAHG
jgi:hypothetical protein